jgi:hypothetical protein
MSMHKHLRKAHVRSSEIKEFAQRAGFGEDGVLQAKANFARRASFRDEGGVQRHGGCSASNEN